MNRPLTNYEEWQLEKYGNIAPTIEELPLSEFLENGCEDADRYREWVMMHNERQEREHIEHYGCKQDFNL